MDMQMSIPKVTCLSAVMNKYELLNWCWRDDFSVALTGYFGAFLLFSVQASDSCLPQSLVLLTLL